MGCNLDRRTFLGGMAVAALPLSGARAQGAAPVRVGLITVKTGALSTSGIQFEAGVTVFLKEKNHTLAGRKIELVVADSGGNPAGAKTKAQELIERDKVDILVGPLAAFEALAIHDYVDQSGIPELSLAAADDLTQRRASPGFIRASASSSQFGHVMGYYAATELKLKRVATIADDFAFGHEQVGGFQRVFEDNGGKVVKKLWPPLNTADYTPYVAQIKGVDGVYSGLAGVNPMKFLKVVADLGLKGKIALVGGESFNDDALLKSLGDEGIGILSAVPYCSTYDSPANRKFVAEVRQAIDNVPGVNTMAGYVNGMVIEQALGKTGGRADDRKAVMKALHAVSFADSPRGPFHFDHLGEVVGNFYITRADKKDGRMVNTIVKTYPDVSQFWTYDEKWFLEQPVYSRDYPPARYLEP